MVVIGNIALVFALVVTLYGVVASLYGGSRKEPRWLRSGEWSFLVAAGALLIASLVLFNAFLTHDFRIEYVVAYSSSDLPLFYTISAFWGGQKGSLLLWALLLSVFLVIVIFQNKAKNRHLIPYVLAVSGVVLVFFETLLVFVTPPFELLPVAPLEGSGLNPLLQNPGMVFHPTLLYLGYIGFTIPFAFAMAALITGKLDDGWIRTTRRWTLMAWFFLTWGILFGAQWAYVELGWGGFWGWDPVESASFMPWLTGTAFLHSVMIQERRGMLKVWNMVLITLTFALTIFGTFLTRSGILSSVHTFSETSMGPIFLGFIGAILIFSIGLLVARKHLLKSDNELDAVVSREASFFANNLLLVGVAFTVFWGTVFPLISEAVRGTKITVGAPFFNQVTSPLFLALIVLTGVCPLLAWRKASLENLKRNFLRPLAAGLLTMTAVLALGVRDAYAVIAFASAGFVFTSILLEFQRGVRARHRISGKGWMESLADLIARNHRRYGGYIVHLGVITFAVGVAGQAFVKEARFSLAPGDTATLGRYTLTYQERTMATKPNRVAVGAKLAVTAGQKDIGILQPEKRIYRNSREPTTEAAIRSTAREDLYVILVGFDGEKANLKVIVNPLIMWLWVAGGVLTLGTFLAVLPDRKKLRADNIVKRLASKQEVGYAKVA